jgi:DNA-binding NarL/FixJ family response regulator
MLDDSFDVVGTVNNGRDAVAVTERSDPNVLVMDISMPILNGLQAARHLKTANQRAKVVFLTVYTDRDFVDAALSVGAHGYVTKLDVTWDLVPAIREALAGKIFISKGLVL